MPSIQPEQKAQDTHPSFSTMAVCPGQWYGIRHNQTNFCQYIDSRCSESWPWWAHMTASWQHESSKSKTRIKNVSLYLSRQMIWFMYISTKNISFPKGLARKLIPKFIGPYKIIRDFGNQLFKIELPMELKRWGIHDIFHVSLLQIHITNDDQLFPRCLQSHIEIGEGEKWNGTSNGS